MARFRLAFSHRNTQQRIQQRIVIASLVAIVLMLINVVIALSHPLGNFTINRYSRIEIGSEKIDVVYVVDMAEIPTHRTISKIDSDGNGTISEDEKSAYLASQTDALAANLALTINGTQLDLAEDESSLDLIEGQAGLPTTRIQIRYSTLHKAAKNSTLDYQDNNFTGQLGWQEVIIKPLDGVTLQNASVPATDQSNELRSYPDDLLTNPPAVSAATAQMEFAAIATTGQADKQASKGGEAQQGSAAGIGKPTDGFAELITNEALTPMAILLALLAAFGWGAAHALSPGHGKAIVGAYLVGTRGTVGHAVFLGLTTTLTHTAGVFALGFVTLFLSNYILPETLYPWLGVLSGLMIVTLGLSLSWSRLRSALGLTTAHANMYDHSHEAADPQLVTRNSQLIHDHGDGHAHSHLPPSEGAVTWRNLLALGVSGGLIPCPSALVLMLGAITLQRVGFGLLLIFIFSLGLASVLSGIGILLVKARSFFDRVPVSGRVYRLLPVASAVFITIVGLGITWQALVSTGFISPGFTKIASIF